MERASRAKEALAAISRARRGERREGDRGRSPEALLAARGRVEALRPPEGLPEAQAGQVRAILKARQKALEAANRSAAEGLLELAKKMRADAQRYLQETEIKARSEAQRLILQARLATQREVKELLRQANEEIHKVLADIRVIRITAQEELAAQKKFTDAARLRSFTLALKAEDQEPEKKKKKQVAGKKQ